METKKNYISQFKNRLITQLDCEYKTLIRNGKGEREVREYFQSLRGNKGKHLYQKLEGIFWGDFAKDNSESLLGVQVDYVLNSVEGILFNKFIIKEKYRGTNMDVVFQNLYTEIVKKKKSVLLIDKDLNYKSIKIEKYRNKNGKLKNKLIYSNYFYLWGILTPLCSETGDKIPKPTINKNKIDKFFNLRVEIMGGLIKKYNTIRKWYYRKLDWVFLKENNYTEYLDGLMREIYKYDSINNIIQYNYKRERIMIYSGYLNGEDYTNMMIYKNKNYKSNGELIKYYTNNMDY
jgi:hypothetical protein